MKRYAWFLAETPVILERILHFVPADRYQEAIAPDRFTLTEMFAHIADMEDLFLDRIRAAKNHSGVGVNTIDPEARAIEKKYGSKDLLHELEVFRSRRNDTVTLINECSEVELQHTFVHLEFGETTIKEFAGYMLGHDIYHIEQLTSYLHM